MIHCVLPVYKNRNTTRRLRARRREYSRRLEGPGAAAARGAGKPGSALWYTSYRGCLGGGEGQLPGGARLKSWTRPRRPRRSGVRGTRRSRGARPRGETQTVHMQHDTHINGSVVVFLSRYLGESQRSQSAECLQSRLQSAITVIQTKLDSGPTLAPPGLGACGAARQSCQPHFALGASRSLARYARVPSSLGFRRRSLRMQTDGQGRWNEGPSTELPRDGSSEAR